MSRQALMRGAAALAILTAGAANAQTAPTDTNPTTPSNIPPEEATRAPGAGDEDQIVVTGSRIRRDPLSQPAPVTFIDRQAIDRTGLTSTADVLQRLPISGGGLNTRNNSSGNFGNPPDGGGVGAGSAEIDLRYLGSRRTLVLVDGLRLVPGSAASGIPASVDLNVLPNGIIERIEVLQDGASPIYGSDAIAGVVNIITKKDQKGFDGSLQYGQYLGKDDGETVDASLTYGAGSDRVKIVFGASYTEQKPVDSADRRISQFPNPFSNTCLDGGCSSGTPLGRFIVNPLNTADGLDLTLRGPVSGRPTVFDPTGVAGDFRGFTTADRFNFQPFNFIVTPSKRYGGFVNASADFGGVTARLKAIYNRRESVNRAAPLPLFVGPDAGNGNLLDTISIDATNPFNPFGVTLSAGGAGGPANYAFIGRRFVENGPRQYEQTIDTMYLTGTLEGEINVGGLRFFWDVNGIIGYNDAEQSVNGNVNAANLARALGPIANCTGDCVPFNIFGGAGSITQAQVDYVAFRQRDSSDQRLADVTVNVTGELFELPGGPLGIAVGYEHRDIRGRFQPDPLVAAGLGSDIPAQPSGGRLDSDEFYAEIRAPLLADRPFFDQLELSFAVRYSDYSSFGDTTNLKAGVLWRPSPDITLRGSWAEGFRAPSIGELFGTPSRFDQVVQDPCSGITAATPATIVANCVAAGVPGNGSYTQLNDQISVITGGNADLQPETSESWNAGVVFSPRFLRDTGFSKRVDLEFNYYDIDLQGAIASVGADVLLGRCAATLDALSCASINRTNTGQIANINGQLQNVAAITTNGVDATLTYRSPETGFGSFGLFLNGNYIIRYREIVPATNGVTRIRREGTERGSPDQAFPQFKGYGTVDWSLGWVNASATGRYIDPVTETGNRLRARFYTDFQIGVRPPILGDRLLLAAGINNVFGLNPPGCNTCSLNNYDPGTYDVPGRFGYLRLSYRM